MIVEDEIKNRQDQSGQEPGQDQDYVVTAQYLKDKSQKGPAPLPLSYNGFFGLDETPFSISPNPRFLFMSEQHQEALAHLLYGVSASNGFILLTGEVGTGKTTVIRAFLQRLPEDARVAYIAHAKLSAMELLETIAEELNIDLDGSATSKALISTIQKKLLEHHSAGYRTYLLIDEAQNLATEVLEEIRLLTNLETDDGKLLHIILVGQPELRDMFNSYELRQLNQRITARYHLNQLSEGDVCLYVQHRLAVARSSRNPFTPRALKAIARYSNGVPRLINIICDRALLAAFSQSQLEIDKNLVKEAAREVLGKIQVFPWEKSKKSASNASDELGWGSKTVAGLLVFAIAGLLAGPYFSQMLFSNDLTEINTLEDQGIQEPGHNNLSGNQGTIAGAAEDAEVAEVHSESVPPVTQINDKTATAAKTPLENTNETRGLEPVGDNLVEVRHVLKSTANNNIGGPEIPQLPLNSIMSENADLEITAGLDDEKENQNQNENMGESLSADEMNVAQSAKEERSSSSFGVNNAPITQPMTFEEGLLALRRQWGTSLTSADEAEILAAGCIALDQVGCLQLEQELDQLLKMETPFLFQLSPGQLRSIGVEFNPPTSHGLTRFTWFMVVGHNKDTDQIDVISHDWASSFSIKQLSQVFLGQGHFILETPVSALSEGKLLDSDHGQWILERIGFADGSTLDPQFDIIVSDETLITAVKAFQNRRNLLADGLFGMRTLIELNREMDPEFPRLQIRK